MANWRYKVELNKVVSEMNDKYDLSHLEDAPPKEVVETIAKEVEKVVPLMTHTSKIRRAKSIASLNRALEMVYDAADKELVWCGF